MSACRRAQSVTTPGPVVGDANAYGSAYPLFSHVPVASSSRSIQIQVDSSIAEQHDPDRCSKAVPVGRAQFDAQSSLRMPRNRLTQRGSRPDPQTGDQVHARAGRSAGRKRNPAAIRRSTEYAGRLPVPAMRPGSVRTEEAQQAAAGRRSASREAGSSWPACASRARIWPLSNAMLASISSAGVRATGCPVSVIGTQSVASSIRHVVGDTMNSPNTLVP